MQTNLAGTYGTETYLKCTRMTKKKSTPNGVLFPFGGTCLDRFEPSKCNCPLVK